MCSFRRISAIVRISITSILRTRVSISQLSFGWYDNGQVTQIHPINNVRQMTAGSTNGFRLSRVNRNPSMVVTATINATGMLVMFCGLLFMESNTPLAIGIMLVGTLGWIASLYTWLLTPLEDHH